MRKKERKRKPSVNLEFSETGYLKAVYLNAETDSDQVTLERALERLFKQNHISWIKRLFKR